MDRQAQIDFILDHYENPRHYGVLTDAHVTATGTNPGCGDMVTIYMKADAEGRITALSFDGQGCTISQAAASVVTEMCVGRTLSDVASIEAEAILELFGREIAATRLKCATLGLNAMKEAVRTLQVARA